jgi:hypothetical protein
MAQNTGIDNNFVTINAAATIANSVIMTVAASSCFNQDVGCIEVWEENLLGDNRQRINGMQTQASKLGSIPVVSAIIPLQLELVSFARSRSFPARSKDIACGDRAPTS